MPTMFMRSVWKRTDSMTHRMHMCRPYGVTSGPQRRQNVSGAMGALITPRANTYADGLHEVRVQDPGSMKPRRHMC